MKVAILGATGFTGEKLVDIISRHKGVELTYLTSRTPQPVSFAQIFPRFDKRVKLNCEQLNIDTALEKSDFFFLALPHTVSMKVDRKSVV